MLELIFTILMFVIFGKILFFAIKAAWGITKILFAIVFLPVVLIVLALMGMFYIAMPMLAVVGLIALFGLKKN